jgi:hypothetical protein
MYRVGYLLITASFLGCSYLAVLDPETLPWPRFWLYLAVGFVGIGLVRWASRQEAAHPERRSANLDAIRRSLGHLAAESERLWQERDEIDVYDLRHRIDERFLDAINSFVGARETLADVFGLQEYADLMSEFAAGERYINRVWSASTDGYIDEAHEYIDRAREQFRQAFEDFTRLQGGPTSRIPGV